MSGMGLISFNSRISIFKSQSTFVVYMSYDYCKRNLTFHSPAAEWTNERSTLSAFHKVFTDTNLSGKLKF